MKQSLTFQYNPMQLKRKAHQSCMQCGAKYTTFSGQHVCKRCYRSVCSTCSGTKTLIWYQNFKQQTHRLCKFCKVQADAIKNYVKTQKLSFGSDSDLAKKWKKAIPTPEQNYRHSKKNVEFNQELLNELWNSLTYSMKQFVGSVLGDKPQGKLQNVQKEMKLVLNELNSRTEIRIQTAAYLSLLLLCYCNSNTAVELGFYLTSQLRKCQTQRQLVNEALKDLSCNQKQMKTMEDYIDQRMRKFVSVLGMNILEFDLVQNILQDIFTTPESIVLMFGAIIGTEKKIVMQKGKEKALIDLALLREGNIVEIKKNYNRIRNKAIKKKQRKNSKKYPENQSEVVSKIQQKQKFIQTRSDLQKVTSSLSRIQSIQSPTKIESGIKSQSFLEQLSIPRPPVLNLSEPRQAVDRTISDIGQSVVRQFGDEWKPTSRRKKYQKTGSYMDLALDFQIQLRQMKSLGMETVVSAEEIKKVHRINEKFEYDFEGKHSVESKKEDLFQSKAESQYSYNENKEREVTKIQSKNNSVIITPTKNQPSFDIKNSYQKQQKYSNNDSSTTKKIQRLKLSSSQIKSKDKQQFSYSNKQKQKPQWQRNKYQKNNISNFDKLSEDSEQQIPTKQSLKRQRQLEEQTHNLKQKLRFYERVLPEKQTLILEYKNKQKNNGSKGKQDNPDINRYKLQSKNLQQRILKLEMQNKRLEKEKNKIEEETMLNRSSVPTNRETSPEAEVNISVYSSSRTVGRDGKSSIQSSSELKKQLRLLEYTLKQKNQYIQTISLENKKLLKDFDNQKREQSRQRQLIRQEFQNKMADMQLDKTKLKYQNQRLMKKLEEMSFTILSLEAQLFDQNRKQFDYQ